MDQLTLKALFEQSSLGIIISNEDGVIEKSNPYASKIFGYDADELNGQKIEILIPAHLKEKHVGYRMQYNKNPQLRSMGSSLNLLAVKKTGDQFPVEISLTFFEAHGKRQIVSFVSDITVRKRAENDLKKLTEDLESKVNERTKELSDALLELSHTNAGLNLEMERRKQVEAKIRSLLEKEKDLNELKSRFVSMASHEFRTPLAGILTSVSLIAKYTKTEEEPKRNKHIQIIKTSVRNLANILNDFLSLDKLDQNKVASIPRKFDFIQFIEDMAEEFRDPNDRQNVFEVKHKDREIILYQDKDMIRNVLINLVTNAIKYSAEMSTIKISTQVKDSSVILEIQDKGIGIPKEDQENLFETFFRAQNVTYIQGTGLGLNIVKRYLDLMGGIIEFTSIENEGSTFTVILPLEKP